MSRRAVSRYCEVSTPRAAPTIKSGSPRRGGHSEGVVGGGACGSGTRTALSAERKIAPAPLLLLAVSAAWGRWGAARGPERRVVPAGRRAVAVPGPGGGSRIPAGWGGVRAAMTQTLLPPGCGGGESPGQAGAAS